jgi:ribosome-associated toxin RatA of RatAB toxin-antitoxin module
MISIEGHRIIRSPIQKVFQMVSHLDSQPRVTGLWMSADLVERKANTLTVHYRGYFGGMPLESIQRATLIPNQRIEFRQTRGALKMLRGEYVLKSIDGDTDLSLSVEAEVGIPLISENSARLVLQGFVENTLQKFKFTAERDLPRVVGARRPKEGAAAGAAATAPASADVLVDLPPTEELRQPEPPSIPVQPRPQQPQQTPGATAPGGGVPGQGKRRRRRRRRRRRGGEMRSPQGPPRPGTSPGAGSGPGSGTG